MLFKSMLVATISLSLVSHNDSSFDKKSPKDLGDWKKDPVCRAVYSGVLKGLEKDNVSSEIVDNIIGKSSSKLSRTERMKRSFVVKCPLCEPTFEAFLAYQQKLKTSNNKGSKANSKSSLTPKEIKALSSEVTMIRLQGLAPVVKKWMQSEFDSNTKLNAAEIAQWKNRVEDRFAEGKTHLIELTLKDQHYKSWSPYWGCAACNGSRDAADDWKKVTSKAKKQ